MKPLNSDRPTALVIGAGHSGLAVAHALHRAGVDVEILERTRRVADAWRHRHPQLRLNTHRLLSSLPGLALPRSAGAFPGRDSVVRYLEDYADRIGVPIRFGVDVRRVEPGRDGWRIATGDGELRTDHVVIATGRDRVPHTPRWPGMDRFAGEILHAAEFGDLERYRGRRILLIGAGNSGTDVLNHLTRIETGRIWVSVRHGPVVFPTRLLGLPVQLLSPVLERLPVPVVDRMLALTERIAFGDLRRLGLPGHPLGGATRLHGDGTAPAIDNGFVRALKAGRVEIVPAIESFHGDRVRPRGRRLIDPEIVICATGYRTGLEPLVGHLGILDGHGVPVIEGAEQDPRWPGLWCTGMRPRLSGFFLAARRNAAAIAAAITAPATASGATGHAAVPYPAPAGDS